MDTKQYKFVGKDFDIEAAPTKIDGYNDEDMAMIENVKGQIEANLKKLKKFQRRCIQDRAMASSWSFKHWMLPARIV